MRQQSTTMRGAAVGKQLSKKELTLDARITRPPCRRTPTARPPSIKISSTWDFSWILPPYFRRPLACRQDGMPIIVLPLLLYPYVKADGALCQFNSMDIAVAGAAS